MMQDVPARVLEHQNTVACTRCGYDIRGLVSDGVCPECGQSIAASLQGDLLQFASPEYLKTLHTGVFLIVSLIIVEILFTLGFIVVVGLSVFSSSQSGIGAVSFDALLLVFSILSQAITLALLYSWWLFTQPDPAYTGRNDGSQARRLVRITIVIQAVISIGAFVAELTMTNVQQGPPVVTSGLGAIGLFLLAADLLDTVSWAVSFFALMMYIRWLSPRIPDVWVYNRAKMLIWLVPLLYIAGSLFIGIGPLIALILYWNMLDRVRKNLKLIRRGDAPLPA